MPSVASEAKAVPHHSVRPLRQPAEQQPAQEGPNSFASLLEDGTLAPDQGVKPKSDAKSDTPDVAKDAPKADAPAANPQAGVPIPAKKAKFAKTGKGPEAPADATKAADAKPGAAEDPAKDASAESTDATKTDADPAKTPGIVVTVPADVQPAQPVAVAITAPIAAAPTPATSSGDTAPAEATGAAKPAGLTPQLPQAPIDAAKDAPQPEQAAPAADAKAKSPASVDTAQKSKPGLKDASPDDTSDDAETTAPADHSGQPKAIESHRGNLRAEVAEDAKPSAPAPKAHAIAADVPATDAAAEPAATRTSGEPVQNLAVTTQSATAAASSANVAAANAPAPVANAVPLAGLAVAISTQANAGNNRFTIRLDPPELGRIDVRLDVDKSGHVTSRLMVERADTLDLLRRDAPQLERALQDAGLKTSDNTLQFSLRDQGTAAQDGRTPRNEAQLIVPDTESAPAEVLRHYGRLSGIGGGIDIQV